MIAYLQASIVDVVLQQQKARRSSDMNVVKVDPQGQATQIRCT